MKYTSKVDRNGNMHLVAMENASKTIAFIIAYKGLEDNGSSLNWTYAKNVTDGFKKAYLKDCAFYKEYNKEHPGHMITCQVKFTTTKIVTSQNKTFHLTDVPYLVVSYNESPDNQWPLHFYNFTKRTNGSMVTYRISYSALPKPTLNKTIYDKAIATSNRSALLVTWGNKTISAEKNASGHWKYSSLSNRTLIFLTLHVYVPGKIVKVSPRCAAKIINDHEVLFNMSKIDKPVCKKEAWLQTAKSKDYFDNGTEYTYYIKDVPIVVVSQEPKSSAQTSSKSGTANGQGGASHSICASVVILLGVLASLVWVGRGVN